MRATSERIWTRSLASRFDSGSSIRKTFGRRTIARPIATRWRWPPESAFGLRSSSSSSPITFAISWTRVLMSAFESFWILRPYAMLSYTVRCGYSA